MKLSTIWTLPSSLGERLRRTQEWFWMGAAQVMPRELAYRSFIKVGADHTVANPDVEVPEMRYVDVLKGLKR